MSEKPQIKPLKNIDMLHELPFYDELSIVKTLKAFKEYACSYSIEVIESKDPSVHLKISRQSIKGLKYQITLKVLLSKYKDNTESEFASVYFNSTTKTVTGFKNSLDKSFKRFLIVQIIG